MTYYIGNETNQEELLGVGNSRYFYALRRTQEGTLYFDRVDQLSSNDAITVNVSGADSDNYEDFEFGVDFYDGRLAEDHTRPYPNLNFDQYRWDNKNCYYYVNENGDLIVSINAAPPSYS